MNASAALLSPVARLSPWTWFAYFMIAAAPSLGSLTTAAGFVASVIAAWHLLRNRKQYPASPATRYLIFVLAFYSCVLLLAGIRAGIDPAFLKSIPVYSQFIYFIPLAMVLPHKARDMTLLGISRAAMAGVAIAACGAMVESIYTAERVELLSGNPLPFASILAVLSFLCLAQLKQKSIRERWLSIGLFLAGVFTVSVLAMARGATLSIVGFCFLAACLIALSFGWRVSRIINLMAGLSIILVVIFLISVMQFRHNENVQESVSESTPLEIRKDDVASFIGSVIFSIIGGSWNPGNESVYYRLVMYKAGIAAFMEQPIIGYGPQNRFSAVSPYIYQDLELALKQVENQEYKNELQRYQSRDFTHLHNVFLNHAIAAGIAGLIAVTLVVTSPLVFLIWITDRLKRLECMYFALTFSILIIFLGMTNLLFFHDLLNSFNIFNLVVFSSLFIKKYKEFVDKPLWDELEYNIISEFRYKPDKFLRQKYIMRCLHPRQKRLTEKYWLAMSACSWIVDIILPQVHDPKTGKPLKTSEYPEVSPLTLQHVYYLKVMKEQMGLFLPDSDITYFLEIGGGYGNFSRIIRTLGYDKMHVITDLPDMFEIQKAYLKEYPEIIYTPLETENIRPLKTPKQQNKSMLMATFSINEMPLEIREKINYTEFDILFIAHNRDFDGTDNIKYFTELKKTMENKYDIQHYQCKIYSKCWFFLAERKMNI